jgi:hypothetical protein
MSENFSKLCNMFEHVILIHFRVVRVEVFIAGKIEVVILWVVGWCGGWMPENHDFPL